MTESPLKEFGPESLQELFNKNPREMTDADYLRIIEELRKARASFNEEDAKPKKKKEKADENIKLEDIGL